MSLDLTPAAVAAPRARRIFAHALTEASLLVRNGEQLILALVIPVGVLVAGLAFGDRLGLDARQFPASVLALALWSTSFTSLAIATGFERRYGVLERLTATPLTRGDLVAGKALATAGVALAQVGVLALVALALGWRPVLTLVAALTAATAAVLALIAFAGFALMLAGRARAEITLAVANLVYVAVAAAGALVVPVASYPGWARPVLGLLPPGALGETLRAAADGVPAPPNLIVLAGWAAISLVIARKVFRWTS